MPHRIYHVKKKLDSNYIYPLSYEGENTRPERVKIKTSLDLRISLLCYVSHKMSL